MNTRESVVAEARTWLDTPFKDFACLKGVAVDCLGLVKGIVIALQLPVPGELATDPRLKAYSNRPDGLVLLEICDRHLEPAYEPGLGDMLVMAFALNPQHFAIVSRVSIYGDPTHVIHCYNSTGVRRVVENGIRVANARIVRAYRLPGVAA